LAKRCRDPHDVIGELAAVRCRVHAEGESGHENEQKRGEMQLEAVDDARSRSG